jgi:hypothetical protein
MDAIDHRHPALCQTQRGPIPIVALFAFFLLSMACPSTKPAEEDATRTTTAPQDSRRIGKMAEQSITLPTPGDIARLSTQRAVVEAYLTPEDRETKYRKAAGKLGLLRALLEAKVFKPDQTYELQCMGIVLGDAFVEELGLEWVIVEDEFGRDPAVRLPGTSTLLFPLTMISKRVETGKEIDVFDIFNWAAAQVDKTKTTPQ